jgi:anti-sigma factor RsiW
MRARTIPALLSLAALLAAGCAGGGALDVGYPEATANRALLASVGSRRVEIRPVADRRMDTARIAALPDRGNVVTSRPVADIVRDALAVEIARNGHELVTERGEVVLAADVEEFWLDAVTGYATTQYVGRVVIALGVLDGRSGERLAARRYVGIRRRVVDKPGDDAAREVMDAALARAIHDLATDRALVAAFARVTAGAPPR